MVTRKQTLVAMAGLVLGAVAPAIGRAAVTNPSFETGDMTGWSVQSPGGWASGAGVIDNAADQANQYPSFAAVLPGNALGTHYAQLSGFGDASPAYAWQDVGALQPNTTYTLTIAIGVAAFDWSPPPGTISLVNGADQTGATLASANISTLGMGSYANNFKDLTATFTTGDTVTGDLTIVVTTAGGFNNYNSLKYDNVRLSADAAVPEPAMLGLIGTAGLLIVRRRRV